MKQSAINYKSILILALAMIVAIGFTAILTTDVTHAKTKNKALKVGMSFTGDPYMTSYAPASGDAAGSDGLPDAMVDNSYSVYVTCKNTVAVKEGMTMSGKLYIPKKLLSKTGDTMIAVPVANFVYDEADSFYVTGKYAPIVSNSDGVVTVKLYDMTGEVPAGSMAKLTRDKTKNYYVLQLKNFPFEALPKDVAASSADKKYTASMIFSLAGYGEQCGAFLYVDDLQLNAVKATKITFNKKDYQGILPFRTYYPKHQLPYELAVVK